MEVQSILRATSSTLDLNGFLLEGSVRGYSIGIHSRNRFNITVRNGRVSGFYYGIEFEGLFEKGGGHLIEKMQFNNQSGGILMEGTGNTIQDNRLNAMGGILLIYTRGTLVSDNFISNIKIPQGAIAILISHSTAAVVRDNTVLETIGDPSYAIATATSDTVLIDSNRLMNSSTATTGIWNNDVPATTSLSCTNNIIGGFATATSGCSFKSGNIEIPAGPHVKR